MFVDHLLVSTANLGFGHGESFCGRPNPGSVHWFAGIEEERDAIQVPRCQLQSRSLQPHARHLTNRRLPHKRFPVVLNHATEDVECLRPIPEGTAQRPNRCVPYMRIPVALGQATEDDERSMLVRE